MRLSNTITHGIAGMLAGIVVSAILHLCHIEQLVYVAGILYFAATVLFELWQCDRSTLTPRQYWDIKKWDSIMDIVAGNGGYWVLMMVSIFGSYAGNVLRP